MGKQVARGKEDHGHGKRLVLTQTSQPALASGIPYPPPWESRVWGSVALAQPGLRVAVGAQACLALWVAWATRLSHTQEPRAMRGFIQGGEF